MAKRRNRNTRSKRYYKRTRQRLRFPIKPSRSRVRTRTSYKPAVRRDGVLPTPSEVKRPQRQVQPIRGQSKNFTKKKNRLLTNNLTEDKMVCKKRRIRKEVMHATRRSGQAGQNKPKWTNESRLKC